MALSEKLQTFEQGNNEMVHDIAPARSSTELHTVLRDWPSDELPRDKLITHGAETLSDAELLSILIHSGRKQLTALDIAKRILAEYGSLRGIAKRTVTEMTVFAGIGPARAVVILAAVEMGRRLRIVPLKNTDPIRSPQDVALRFIPRLQDLSQEVFYVVLLNTSGRIIKESVVTKGIVNASLVHPREIFRIAVMELATSVIVIHNHPGGTEEPSREDREITRQLVEAGKILGIPIRDHLIICGDRYVSFAERGWI